ncbi:unnamed protein product [Linum tenue]|uniref:Uncharacterized protein n=1 Tax=Linum tenue TaxID=586396 RepID=A0AAV0Q2D3_9ROSI|nr:unnamed protein product [Linum tenue]
MGLPAPKSVIIKTIERYEKKQKDNEPGSKGLEDNTQNDDSFSMAKKIEQLDVSKRLKQLHALASYNWST